MRCVLNAGRRQRPYRLEVAEPTKGSVLIEKDMGSSLLNAWAVSTVPGSADRSCVTLTTQWEGSGSVGGFFERTFAPRVLRRLYGDMLESLARSVGILSSDIWPAAKVQRASAHERISCLIGHSLRREDASSAWQTPLRLDTDVIPRAGL